MLDPAIKALATGDNFAVMSFQLPSGTIASHVMWVDADDEHLLINTEIHRAKYRSLAEHPQVTITVWNTADPYQYAEVRGHVAGEKRGEEARTHIDALSEKYRGTPYAKTIESERVIVLIAPDRQRSRGL
jgi:PPOX class probable F420-dependent enzyme